MSNQPKPFQKTALSITKAIGSPTSIVIHTLLFAASFLTVWLGVFSFDRMLLVLTTVLSLEAIYLSLFIQMTVNYTTESIVEVEQDIDEIQGDIDEIQEDVEEMQEDVEEMSEEPEGKTLEEIHAGLQKLIQDVERLQNRPS
jgi:low affinity Fe/Cu permease